MVLLYLDQSHLSHMALANKPGAPERLTRLEQLVENGRATPVLSVTHLLETAATSKAETRAQICRLLDRLNSHARWLHDPLVIMRREAAAAYEAHAAGLKPPTIDAYSRGLQDMVREREEDPLMLWARDVPPSELVAGLASGGSEPLLRRGEAYCRNVGRYRDRASVSSNQDWSRRNRVAELAPVRLSNGTLTTITQRRQFADRVPLSYMPSFILFHQVLLSVMTEQFDQAPDDEREERGDIPDWNHAVALPYVDVFTCDRYTNSVLGRLRDRGEHEYPAFAKLDLALAHVDLLWSQNSPGS